MRSFLFVLSILLPTLIASANGTPNPWREKAPDLMPAKIPPQPMTLEPVKLEWADRFPETMPAGNSNATLRLTITEPSSPARLKLPHSLIQSLLPAPPQSKADAGGMSPARTVMAGLAICAAITLGGLAFVRRRSSRFGRGALVAITGTLIFAAVHAAADIPLGRKEAGRKAPAPAAGNSALTVELTDGDFVEMQLPSAPVSH